ncbi:MAG: chalcone isomerase family protein [Pseudomonadota bacterium]|nr:chalcone isomerase family protein [Pseudomonadota bacterium]
MKILTANILMLMLSLISTSVTARDVNGVEIPEAVTQSGSQKTLILNGAGVRGKFIFDIYVGALYLVARSESATEIITDSSPKRVMLHFLYSEIEQKKMQSAWREAFEDNLSDAELAELDDEINKFNSAFGDTVQGDVVVIDFLPANTTRVEINGARKVNIESPDFQRALLSVWLGDSPVDGSLKRGMLGRD